MSAVQHLRQFVGERLAAAAEEIFGVFEKTIVEYEKEIDRQRSLLDIVLKPRIRLNRIELQQLPVYKQEEGEEGEVVTDQQLQQSSNLDQEGSASPRIKPDPPQIKHEDPDPPQIKPEDPDPPQSITCTGEEEARLGLKQEIDAFTQIPICAGSCDREGWPMNSSPAEIPAEEGCGFNMPPGCSAEAEPRGGKRLLLQSSPEDAGRDHRGAKHGRSEPNASAEARPRARLHEARGCSNSEHDSAAAEANEAAAVCPTSFKCDACGKAFRLVSRLHRHMRTHTDEKPNPCDSCGKRFRDLSALRVHMRVHTGEKPYSCGTCGRVFRHTGGLKIHMATHANEKPYTCNTCQKTFGDVSHLKSHQRTHTGDKPYPCKTCGQTFSHLSALKIHKRSHTGEAPHSCQTCGKHFRYNCELKAHVRRNTCAKLPCLKKT